MELSGISLKSASVGTRLKSLEDPDRQCSASEVNEAAACERVGEVPHFRCHRMSQEQGKGAHDAKVTGGRDRETSS